MIITTKDKLPAIIEALDKAIKTLTECPNQ